MVPPRAAATLRAPSSELRGASAAWLFIRGPRDLDAHIDARYGEGTTREVNNGRRIERRGGLRVGSAQESSQIFDAVLPRGRGWRLIRRGRLDDVRDFLDPLPDVDPTVDDRYGRGAGRVVRIHEGAVADLSLPLPGHHCLDAAFSDERRGVAIMEPGRAFHTEDGGARWIELTSGRYTDTVAVAGHRWILGRDGCVALDDAGCATPTDCRAVDPYLPAPLPYSIRRAPPPDVVRHVSADQLPVDRAALVGSDAALLRTPQGIATFDLRTGAARLRGDPPLPCVAGEEAERLVHPIPAVRCSVRGDDSGYRFALWRHARGRWELVMRGRQPWNGACWLRDDGEAAVCRGTCEGFPHRDDDRCVRDQPHAARAVRGRFGDQFAGWLRGRALWVNPRDWSWTLGDDAPRALLGPGSVAVDLQEENIATPVAPIGRDGVLRLALSRDPHARYGLHVIEGEPGGRFVLRADVRDIGREGEPSTWPTLHVCGGDGVVVRRSARGLEVSHGLGMPWAPLLSSEDPALRRWMLADLRRHFVHGCDGGGVDLGYARSIGWGMLRSRLLGPTQPAQGIRREDPPETLECQGEPRRTRPLTPTASPPMPAGQRRVGLDGFTVLTQIAQRPERATLLNLLGPSAVRAGYVTRELPWPEELSSERDVTAVSVVGLATDRTSLLSIVARDGAFHLTLIDQVGGDYRRAHRWRFPGSFPPPVSRESCRIMGCPDLTRSDRFGTVDPLWDGTRALATVSLPGWQRGRARRVLLIDHAIGGAVREAVLEIGDVARAGVYADGADGGVAFEDTAGVVWGMNTEGVRRRIAPALAWEPCTAGARGTVVLPAYVRDGRLTRPIARAEFGLNDVGLCLRRVVDEDFVIEPVASALRARYIEDGVFVGESRCERWTR